MTRIKICGLSKKEHILWANEVLPDYIGFVFAPSRRSVTIEQAINLRTLSDRRILAVGVFVDAPLAQIYSLLEKGVIDLVQLHGDESVQYIQALRMKTNLPIIKAFKNPKPSDLLSPLALAADYLLLDSKQPGSGQCFDWSVTKSCTKPFFLAGGLNVENLGSAIQSCKPYAVDLSSSVEVSGQKDQQRMAEVVACAHRWYV